MSKVSLGVKAPGTTNVCFYFQKWSTNGQLQVSENKDADFPPSRVMDALGKQWALTSGTERKPGRGPWGPQPQPCRAAWGERPEKPQAGQAEE